MYIRPIAEELLWFIKGDTNIKYLVDRNVKIWNEWPYEKYKNTSTDWISNIPSHWETNRFKITFSYSKGKNPQTFSDEKKEFIYMYDWVTLWYSRN